MSILIFALIVLLILAMAIYAVDLAPIGDGRVKGFAKIILVVIAILVIVQRAGIV
jgi:hypothetical protein